MSAKGVPSISINHEACKRDGLCARLCPMRLFKADDGAVPEVRRPEECILCGHCVAGCPSGAILHQGLEVARLRRCAPSGSLASDQAYALLSERRSVRNYKKEPPPREFLEKIVEVAGYAPGSPHHRLGWVRSFTVVLGEERMRQVREIAVDYLRRICKLLDSLHVRWAARFDESARAAREALPDLRMRLTEWERGRDQVAIFAHAPVFSPLPQIDCDAALTSVLLYAHAHGLGTCWNGILQDAARGNYLKGYNALHEFLGIPDGHLCFASATLGYPSLKLLSVPPREVAVAFLE